MQDVTYNDIKKMKKIVDYLNNVIKPFADGREEPQKYSEVEKLLEPYGYDKRKRVGRKAKDFKLNILNFINEMNDKYDMMLNYK